MKKKNKNKSRLFRTSTILAGAVLVGCGLAACGDKEKSQTSGTEKQAVFEPRLDTEKEVALDITGFFGNFEALDQVANNFNEYYPNVTISYSQSGGSMLKEYLDNNQYVDIFMSNYDNVCFPDQTEKYIYDYCLDLSGEDIDLSAIQPEMIEACKLNGELVRVPIGQSIRGMVVNKTLLEKEGIKMPENYQEFLTALEALKQKGYTPIQGSSSQVYSCLVTNMAMNLLAEDETAKKSLEDGDGSGIAVTKPAWERLDELIQKGYTDDAVNSTYPYDNYDEAILRFFEGDVPFWICDSEKVSGMKKRESKSEAYTAAPFEYEFMYVPIGDNGAYAYQEPWYGFSVNKNSEGKDYAVEFIRFLMMEDQINQMANIKGVPSVAVHNSDERYKSVLDTTDAMGTFINDGSISSEIRNSIDSVAEQYGTGKFTSLDEAMDMLKTYCTK